MTADSGTPETPPEEVDPTSKADRPRRRSIFRRVIGWVGSGGLNLLIAVAIVGVIGVFAVRTALGNSLVVRAGVSFADGQVDGQIRIGDVRSANLLRGARLLDIALLTPAGDTLLAADSLELDYQVLPFLRGEISFSDIRLWGADIRFVQEGTVEAPGRSTIERFIGPRESAESESEGLPVVLSGLEVHDSRFTLRRPLAVAEASVVRTSERDGVRDLDLEADVEFARFGSVEVLSAGRGGTTVEIDEFRGELRALDEPIVVRQANAEIRVSSTRLIADLQSLDTDLAQVSGTVSVGLGGPTDIRLQLDAAEADLGSLSWISEQIPAMAGSFGLQGRIEEGSTRWTISAGDLAWAGGTVRGGGTLQTGSALTLRNLDVTLASVSRSAFDRWMPGETRVPGAVSGNLQVDGPLDSLRVRGTVALRAGARVTAGRVDGAVLRGEDAISLAGFRIELDRLAWEMVGSIVPGFGLTGQGAANATLTGSVEGGFLFDLDARHEREGWAPSHLLVSGTAQRAADSWIVDVSGDASPLSLATIRQDYPELPMEGALSGSFRARGPVTDLQVETDLTGDFGRARLNARLNPARPADGIEVTGDLIDFEAGRFLTGLGERTRITAEVDLRGSGRDLASLEGEGRVRFAQSRIQGVDIDSAVVAGRIVSSDLQIDSLRGRVGGFDLYGNGKLAVDSLRPAGELRLNFATESLAELRPAFLGDTVIARDTLQALEREVLTLNGIDPDTLPLLDEVRFDGRLNGDVVLRGSVTDFTAEGELFVRQLERAYDYVEAGEVTFSAAGLPSRDAEIDFTLQADSSSVFGRDLESARIEGRYRHPEGDVMARLVQQGSEELNVDGAFTLADGGIQAELRTLSLQIDSTRYALQRPAGIVWTDSTRSVRDFELLLEGPEPVRILADGTLPYQGEADFHFRVDRMRIDRLLRVLQREELEADGIVDVDLQVTGMASSPIIEGTVRADSVELLRARFDEIAGDVSYRDRSAQLSLTAVREGDEVLDAEGSVPVDLSLAPGVDRFPDEALDLRVRTRELPARAVLALIQDLEQVEGSVTGDFRLAGTIDDPEASGELRLQGGAWTVGSVGVRQSGVEGTLAIRPDGTIAVDARVSAGGSAEVSGTIDLATLTDPGFDLDIALDNFRAVDRLDIAGSVSGALQLNGRFRRPLLEGELEVDEGTLFLDEFQRNIGVLDLSDPRFTSVVDTTDIGGRALLSRAQNPFMDGLTVDILMDVESNTWMRGRDLQVEIQGQDVLVVYDRQQRDLTLVGDFNVVRGQAFFGTRAFEVQGGQVRFRGTPGINPTMDIRASTRIRRQNEPPLDISIAIGGTLLRPDIQPSSDEQGLSESDLYSYIVFGQPSSSLTRGQLGGGGAGGAALGAAGSWLSGTVANQLAALASQELSLIDYFAISQVGDLGVQNALSGGGVGSSFASTQVEIGRYFANGEIFGALVLRPLTQLGTNSSVIGGARMEWQSSDLYHLEAFVEDRFLRSSGFGLGQIGSDTEYIIGFALIREWGY